MKTLVPVLAMVALPLMLSGSLAVSTDHVVVICNCSVDAYREALEGIREVLGRDPVVFDPDKGGPAALADSARQRPGSVYIAIGREALQHALLAKPDLPVIGAMMLREDAAAEGPAAGQINLDPPPRLLLQELRRLFPRVERLGVLVSDRVDRASFLTPARELGLTLRFADAGGAANLVKAFRSFRGDTDLVLTLPDSALYNGATVKPLVLASLEARIPIVGFSAAFVRAGAAAGVFADFRDAGRQAAEAALRLTPGRTPRFEEQPRKLTVAVNQRVLRLLGLDYEHSSRVVVYR